MSLFASKDATVTAHHPSWPENQKVFIRRDMPWGARRAIEAALFRVRADKGGEVDMQGEVAAMQMETLRQMIVSWTLTDDDGEPVPVTPEAIDNLKGPVASYIYREISRLNPDMAESEEEQPAPSTEGSEGDAATVVQLPKRPSRTG